MSEHDGAGWPADYLAAADRCFADLPPRLGEDLLRLRHSLATRLSPSGQFQDVLAGPADEPWLALHSWLLADCAGAAGPETQRLDREIWLAMLCSLLAATLREERTDEALADWLLAAAERRFAAALPAGSPFWQQHRDCWAAHADWDASDPRRAAGRLAPLRLGCLAAACAAGRAELLGPINAILAGLDAAFELWREFESLPADAAGGRMTPALARVLRAAGAENSPGAAASREWLVGALAFTGVGAALIGEAQAGLDAASATAARNDLPRLADHCAQVRQELGALRSRFSLAPAPAAAVARRPFIPLPLDLTAGAAGELAEGYLLADLTFRESWEIQRGLPGGMVATGRPFPDGSIIEILCRHGHALGEQVAEIFALLAANGFCYFDQPGILPPDTDDLGLLLRLLRFSDQPAAHRAMLAAPLRLFEEHMRPSGAIPVWLRPVAEQGATPFALWGDDCITVQAQFLIGLLDYDAAGYAERIERGARYVCARIGASGLGANRYYAPLYGLWALSALVRRLAPAAGWVAAARAALNDRLDGAAAGAETPQDAALLILAALALGRPDLPLDSWAGQLIATQRYDGSWRDEPLFITGDRRGRAGWYSSRSLTTALCYHALKSLAVADR